MRGCLLDTNVVSELQKGEKCSPQVRAWHNRSGERELFLSVLVLGELRRGVELRRLRDPAAAQALEIWFREAEASFSDRILPVTLDIAERWGRLSLRELLPPIDGLLAATALHHGLTLVTRNTKDIQRSGVDCLDPFVD